MATTPMSPVDTPGAAEPEITSMGQVDSNTPTQDEIEKAFTSLLLSARDEDRFIRQSFVSVWRRLEYYWNNILDIFLDPVTREWRVPDWAELEDEVPPRLINIYRPHGEAIVAALSVAIPSVYFHPDDADNPDDIDAAKAYRAIVDLLELHNEASMLFIRVIVIMFNQGTVFGYNYYHSDPKFGTYSKPKVEFRDIQLFEAYCPSCGEPLDAGVVAREGPPQQSSVPPQGGQQAPNVNPQQQGQSLSNNQAGAPPTNQPPPNQPQMPQQANRNYSCPTCGYNGKPHIKTGTESLPQIVGWDNTPKGSICQELFSGLQVKVPAYARKQEECGYLLLEFVQSVPMLRYIFKDAPPDKVGGIKGKRYQRELNQFLKLPLQYTDQMPDNAANVSCMWLRPWQFYDLAPQRLDMVQYLTSKYPTGCYALFIDDELFDVVEENIDDHWTISNNPFSPSIYARPAGENLATIQDIRAQLTEIELQTIEHGIPETFADPKTLDFNKYAEGRSKPGMMTQAKSPAGKALADGFFSSKPATLSQEVQPFRQSIDNDAQFVAGSFPSIYGGPAEGGKTLGEYSQSRSMALQRIGTLWKISCQFWSRLQSRSATEYAGVLKELNQDERYTKREGSSFINVWIRAASLNGRVGRVEPEATEQLPTSWAQKKDAITQLFQSKVPEVLQVLTDPNNASLIKNIIGINELYVPGEDDRIRQRKEFILLSQGVSVPVRPGIDNDAIHAEVLRGILESSLGESLDPEAEQACMQHLQQHMQAAQASAPSRSDPPRIQTSVQLKGSDLSMPEAQQMLKQEGIQITPVSPNLVQQQANMKQQEVNIKQNPPAKLVPVKKENDNAS